MSTFDSTFRGWWRGSPGMAWECLAAGDTYEAAWQLLLARRPRGNGDLLVLPSAKTPDSMAPAYRHVPGRRFGPAGREEK